MNLGSILGLGCLCQPLSFFLQVSPLQVLSLGCLGCLELSLGCLGYHNQPRSIHGIVHVRLLLVTYGY